MIQLLILGYKSKYANSSAFLSGAVVNNKIYVFGGTAIGATGGLNVWEYDPA